MFEGIEFAENINFSRFSINGVTYLMYWVYDPNTVELSDGVSYFSVSNAIDFSHKSF